MHKVFLINCEVNIKIIKHFQKTATHYTFFVAIATKLEKASQPFLKFNPFLSKARNDKKWNKCHHIVLQCK